MIQTSEAFNNYWVIVTLRQTKSILFHQQLLNFEKKFKGLFLEGISSWLHTPLNLLDLKWVKHKSMNRHDALPLSASCLCNICSSWCTSVREKPIPPLLWQRVRRLEGRGWKGKRVFWVEEVGEVWKEVGLKTETGAGRKGEGKYDRQTQKSKE